MIKLGNQEKPQNPPKPSKKNPHPKPLEYPESPQFYEQERLVKVAAKMQVPDFSKNEDLLMFAAEAYSGWLQEQREQELLEQEQAQVWEEQEQEKQDQVWQQPGAAVVKQEQQEEAGGSRKRKIGEVDAGRSSASSGSAGSGSAGSDQSLESRLSAEMQRHWEAMGEMLFDAAKDEAAKIIDAAKERSAKE